MAKTKLFYLRNILIFISVVSMCSLFACHLFMRNDYVFDEEYIEMNVDGTNYKKVIDASTGVMYLSYYDTITILFDSDGNPLIYDGLDEYIENQTKKYEEQQVVFYTKLPVKCVLIGIAMIGGLVLSICLRKMEGNC